MDLKDAYQSALKIRRGRDVVNSLKSFIGRLSVCVKEAETKSPGLFDSSRLLALLINTQADRFVVYWRKVLNLSPHRDSIDVAMRFGMYCSDMCRPRQLSESVLKS
jgi:hypothetical protein